jgi:hypothetical protein
MLQRMRRSIVFSVFSAFLTCAVLVVPAAAQAAGWQGGPGAILDNTYDGFIDVPAAGATVPGSGSFTVAGWFVDRTAQGWAGADDIQVFLGSMGSGGTMLAKAQIAQSRPDVAAATGNPFWAASGFTAVVNAAQVPAGSQTLNVYAHTPGKGWWFKQVTVTGGGPGTGAVAPAPAAPVAGAAPQVEIQEPQPNADVSTRSDFTITGTATDPGFGPSGIDDVQVFINGERDSPYSTLLGTTTPDASGNWTLTFQPTKYPSMHSNLFVYAHSKNTGKETLATREFDIVDR